jgi:hypothetical protein
MKPSNGNEIENEEKPSPENPSPKGGGQLRKRGRDRSAPIGKPQNEKKKDKQRKEPFEDLFPPKIAEPDEEKGKKSADRMILCLKLLDLRRFLFDNLRVKLFLLNENAITIEANKVLVRSS